MRSRSLKKENQILNAIDAERSLRMEACCSRASDRGSDLENGYNYAQSVPLPEPPIRVTVAKLKSNAPAAAKRYQDQFRIDLEKKTRIICFSQRNDGILMWAHYADRHKGFVVGFKPEVLRRDYPHSGFYKVSYGIQRPVIPHPYVGVSDENQLIAAGTQKSMEWKYEEEWRLLVDVKHLCRDSDPNDPNLYLPISSGAIDQVIFGSRC